MFIFYALLLRSAVARITRCPDARGGGYFICLRADHGDGEHDLAAFIADSIRALEGNERCYPTDDNQWWVSQSGMKTLLHGVPALADAYEEMNSTTRHDQE